MVLRMLSIILLCSLCAACAHTDTLETQWPAQTADQRQQRLLSLQSWRVTGAFVLRSQSQKQYGRFVWTFHDNQHYQWDFMAPFALQHARLIVTPRQAVLRVSGQPERHATSADALLYGVFGQAWPISALSSWAKAMPLPRLPASQTINARHYLRTLQQAGWLVNYQKYQWGIGVALPRKLSMSNGQMQMDVTFDQWQSLRGSGVRRSG
jgi:outer membrane lipoprotein LolB